MRLTSGTVAPDFVLADSNGDKLRLSEMTGTPVWLAFFRYAGCPLCNLRVRDIAQRHAQLTKAGLKILAVFQSPPESIASHVGRQEPPFPILADPDESVYEQYGLETSWARIATPRSTLRSLQAARHGFLPGLNQEGSVARIPADFLIDADGVIHTAFYGEDISDHISFDEVEAFLAQCNGGSTEQPSLTE